MNNFELLSIEIENQITIHSNMLKTAELSTYQWEKEMIFSQAEQLLRSIERLKEILKSI